MVTCQLGDYARYYNIQFFGAYTKQPCGTADTEFDGTPLTLVERCHTADDTRSEVVS